jgi:hypothetical protein
MKIRKGFVSNSSSSSFIVAVDKGTNVKCTSNPMTCNLNDYVNHTIKTEKELWEYYQDNCGYNTDIKKNLLKDGGIEIKEGQDINEVFDDYHWKIAKELGYNIHCGDEDGVKGTVIGKRIVSMDDDGDVYGIGGSGDGEISLSKITSVVDELQEKLGCDTEPKIYYGTRLC